MKKTLVVVAHPDIKKSIVNKHWMETLQQYPDMFTVHELYKTYPTGNIDIEKEQDLIEQHGSLVFQFPLYWFNCTPLLKKWFDDVLTYGWAYGSHGEKLNNKKIGLAISVGIKESDYSKQGKYKVTMEEILRPFELIMMYVKANYQSFHAFYGVENEFSVEKLKHNTQDYIDFLSHLAE